MTHEPTPGNVPDPPSAEIAVESLAGLKPKPVKFLFPLFPLGMLILLAGDGGLGKSFITLAIAAALSVGRCAFGMKYDSPARGKTLLICCEDDWERTIVPRLVALKADLDNILRIKGLKLKKDGKTLDFHLGHYREVERLLEADPDIKLIVIDPAGAYIGRAGVNDNKDSELRALLGPLSEVANRRGVTILLVKHLNKSADASAVHRVGGSVGYVNAVRVVFLVAPDPNAEGRVLMLPIKKNVLPPDAKGFAYKLVTIPETDARKLLTARWPDLDRDDLGELSKQLFDQEWEHGVSADADAATRGKKKEEKKADKASVPEQALEWLRRLYLNPDGSPGSNIAYPSKLILRSAGRGRDSVYTAKDRAVKEIAGFRYIKSLSGEWVWGVGDPLAWEVRDAIPDPLPELPKPASPQDRTPAPSTTPPTDSQEDQEVQKAGSSGRCGQGPERPELPDAPGGPERPEHPSPVAAAPTPADSPPASGDYNLADPKVRAAEDWLRDRGREKARWRREELLKLLPGRLNKNAVKAAIDGIGITRVEEGGQTWMIFPEETQRPGVQVSA